VHVSRLIVLLGAISVVGFVTSASEPRFSAMPQRKGAAAAQRDRHAERRYDDIKSFVVLPRRWVVERTFSWFGRNRRLAKDSDNLWESLATFVTPPTNYP
jgi:transposase